MNRIIGIVTLACLLPALAFGQNVVVEKELIYGRAHGSALLADIGYPENGEDLPAIIYVHGGRWRGGDRNYRQSLQVDQWADFGFFAMTIDHRLVGQTPAPAAYQDFLCAIRWVHAHAEEYGIDPDRVYVIGDSSGGHLAALAATLGDGPYERSGGWDGARSDIRAAISAAGPYELNTLSWAISGHRWKGTSRSSDGSRRPFIRSLLRPGRYWSFIPMTTAPCRCSRRTTWRRRSRRATSSIVSSTTPTAGTCGSPMR